MIKEKETENKSAGYNAWFALLDARNRSIANMKNFTQKQKVKADRVKMALQCVYSYENITIDYCKKHVRVKVHNPSVKNKKMLRELEEQWNIEGIVKVVTPQGIIYRVV